MRGRPFEKGHKPLGGRKKGVPNNATLEFKEFWGEFFKSEDYRVSLQSRIVRGEAQQMERYIAEMVYGKPKEQIELSGGPVKFTLNLGDYGNGRRDAHD